MDNPLPLKELKKEFEEPIGEGSEEQGFGKLSKKIDTVISRIQSLRSEVETVL